MGRTTGVRAVSGTSIEITFTYRGERCRERIKLEPTPTNLKKAGNHRAAILAAIEDGAFDYATTFPESIKASRFAARPGGEQLLQDYLTSWIDSCKVRLKSSTHTEYERTIRNVLVPVLGHIKVRELKRIHVREWLDGLGEMTASRLDNLTTPLRAALRDAADDEVIETNPLYGWSYRRKETIEEHDDDVDPFTSAEQASILAVMEPQTRNYYQFAFWSGMRPSELVALEWGDVDWERGIISVRRAQTQYAKKPETPKTKTSRREIKLLSPAIGALEAQKQYSLLGESGRIFLNPRTSEPWGGPKIVSKYWVSALKRAKVRHRRQYQTRHTYASMMLSAGEHPMWVAKQLGHSNWTLIGKVYGKFIPEAAPNAGEKAVKMFGNLDQNASILPASPRN